MQVKTKPDYIIIMKLTAMVSVIYKTNPIFCFRKKVLCYNYNLIKQTHRGAAGATEITLCAEMSASNLNMLLPI